jgi:uncharacterized membrane protein YhaH (DUF805 family)
VGWRQYLFGFDGRIGRLRMWRFYLVAWAIEMVLLVLIFLVYGALAVLGVVGGNTPPSANPGIAMTSVFALFFLAIYYMYAAVAAKRLHDRDKSAWWVLPFFVVPLALILTPELKIANAHDRQIDLAVACAVSLGAALYLWGFIELYCLRGTTGENRYGPDPLSPAADVEQTF